MVWDDEKVLILRDEYEYSDLKLLADKLGTTIKGVRRKAEKLNLKRATNNQIRDGYKYCSLCKVEHSISEFYKNKAKSYGYEYYCKKYYNEKVKRETDFKIERVPLPHSFKGGKMTDDNEMNVADIKGHSSKRPRNPIVIKNNIQGKVCNKCKCWKPLDSYWNSEKGIAGK